MPQLENIDTVELAMRIMGDRGLAKQDGRIAFQKLFLLLQSIHNGSEYKFTWGMYGPYSPTLADEMHERLAIHLKDGPSEAQTELYDKIKSLTGGSCIGPTDFLEILASFEFIGDTAGFKGARRISFLKEDPRKARFIQAICPNMDNEQASNHMDRLLGDLKQIVITFR